MSILKKYMTGAGTLAFQSAFQRAVGIFTNALIVRIVNPVQFGIFNAVTTTASSAYGMARLGIDAALHVHTAGQDPAEAKSRMLGAGAVVFAFMGVGTGAVCYFASGRLAVGLFGNAALAGWLKFSAVLALLQWISQLFYTTLVGFAQYARFSTAMTLFGVFQVVILLAGAAFGGGLKTILVAVVLSQGVLIATYFHFTRLTLAEQGVGLSLVSFGRNLAEILRIGFPIYAAGLIGIPVNYYLQATLSRLYGIESLGYLRVMTTVNSLINFLPLSVAAASISTFTELWSDPDARSGRFMAYTLFNIKAVWFFGLLAAVLAFSVLPFFVSWIFGKAYLPALQAAQISLFSAALYGVMNALSHFFFSQKKSNWVFLQILVQSVVCLLTGLYLIPALGLVGFALSEFLGLAVMCAFFICLGFLTRSKPRGQTKRLTLLLGVTVALSIGASTTFSGGSEHNGLLHLAFGLPFFAALLFFGYHLFMDATEKEHLRRIFADHLWGGKAARP